LPVYTLNQDAVRHAKRLIDQRQYVLRSRWQNAQPRAREQNAFLKAHSWDDYAAWHLGLTEGAAEETKARYAFVYGDLRRLHRMGLIACHYRAAEWRHKEIELAAHELHDDEKAETVTAFVERALAFFAEHGIVAKRLMTDNGFSYVKNRSLRELLARREIRHLTTQPYRPRTNGKVERFHQTMEREWAYGLSYRSHRHRNRALPHWLDNYNHRRPHSSIGDRPPISRVHNVRG
jgi:transposase InsO family protein